jgi:hypothetical protein
MLPPRVFPNPKISTAGSRERVTPEIFVSEEGSLGLCTPTDRKPVVDSQKFATAGSGETIFDVITFSITVMIQFCDLLGLG